ncbi:hypothetical protein GP486_004667 [Trichoglossum hirsutum]|uniref:Protein kinase domain-containing protein n=1 Tax=Trichoglossum hirsutum TaxID=265104 RepID=A0A9P8LAQ4_9PEZI|nr:hypothetical protein GP486_004667 [Trichoglossum hirsutum]
MYASLAFRYIAPIVRYFANFRNRSVQQVDLAEMAREKRRSDSFVAEAGYNIASPQNKRRVYSSDEEDPYHSVSFLGQGGFGSVDEVFKRSDLSQTRYARKRFKFSRFPPSQRQELANEIVKEADIIRTLCFRHIVRLVESYTWKAQFCIVMSPVAETNLGQFLSEIDSMEIGAERNKARELVLQWPGCLIRAIDYLHEMRIKHRDIKPSNILIKQGVVYLTDFGTSKAIAENETTGTTGPVGPHTYAYSPPEVLSNDGARRGRATDIFSLGCIFLEISTTLLAPPSSREAFTKLRLERTQTLAYAHNEKTILHWILHLWAHWSLVVRGKCTDDDYAHLGGSLPDLAFMMLDPNPAQRITARQLVAMITTPRLYYFATTNAAACSGCRVAEGFEDTNLPLHSEFKDPDDLKYAHNPSHALKILPALDWESTKKEWLKSHMWWAEPEKSL